MKHHIISLLTLLLCTCAATAQVKHIEDRGIVPGENNSLASQQYDGIDVSKYQGEIDWAAIANNKNVKFAYIKATEGATHVDPQFERNIAEARKHGVKVGCYHFLRSSSSIADQFENLKRYVRREEQDLVPMIDVEAMGKWSQKQLVDSLHTFAVMIYEYYQCAPIIYTYVNFYNRNLAGRFTNYPLFVARYTDTEPVLDDGTQYVIWQYSERGHIDGIKGNVDLSRFGNGYSVHDITIKSQHIKGTTGIDIKPEDLVMNAEDIKVETPQKFKSEISEEREKELLKLKQQQAEEEKRLRKQREKEAKRQAKEAEKRAKEEAKARREAAERNARLGITSPTDDTPGDSIAQPNQAVGIRVNNGTNNANSELRYSTRRRTN